MLPGTMRWVRFASGRDLELVTGSCVLTLKARERRAHAGAAIDGLDVVASTRVAILEALKDAIFRNRGGCRPRCVKQSNFALEKCLVMALTNPRPATGLHHVHD